MLAPTIEDVCDPAAVEGMDRSELITQLRALEALRSAWELRVRVCEEKEQLWKNVLSEMGALLALTFQKCHDSIVQRAEEAAKLMDELKQMAKHVEDM